MLAKVIATSLMPSYNFPLFLLFREVMLLCESKFFQKFCDCLFAYVQFRFQHIEGVGIAMIDIRFCWNAAFLQVLDIGQSFTIKRLAVANECIGWRKIGIVGLTCRCGVRRNILFPTFSQI